MASSFATELSAKFTSGVPENVLEWGRRIIDGEMQEVRAVLDSLRQSRDCWCVPPRHEASKHHEAKCQRARDLMEKLEVRP